MEGVLFVIKAWALVGMGLWVYRRFFERVSRAEPEFEAWCRESRLVAAVHGDAATLMHVEASLSELLGNQARVVATLGGWPWTNYALQLRLARNGTSLALLTERACLLRTYGPPPPSLVATLLTLSNRHPELREVWLCPGAVYKLDPNEAPHGWLLEPGAETKPRLSVRDTYPGWLEAAEPLPRLAEHAPAASSKFLKFRAELIRN
jgi:hypothetical protein